MIFWKDILLKKVLIIKF